MPDYNSQQQSLNRRRQLAAAMQQQSMLPIEQPNYPGASVNAFQGLTPIVQALFAGLANRKLDKQQGEIDTQKNAQMAQMAQALQIPPEMAAGMQPEDLSKLGIVSALQARRDEAQNAAAQANKPAPAGFNLSPGQTRYDATGNPIASLPAAQPAAAASAGFSLSPGQSRFDASGNLIANVPTAAPQTAEIAMNPEKVNVDGQPASVLIDKQGNYYEAGSKKPITGRITPYVTPPAPRQKGEITPTAEAGLIQSLNKQWETASKDVQALYRANTIMDAGMDAARKGDMNAGAQAILVTFQKFLDPTSVVRESEYARSGEGLAVAERLRGYIERLQQGGAGVPIAELEKFANLGKQINSKLAAEGTSLLAAEKKRITGVADRYSIPAELAIPSFNFTQPGAPTAAPAGGGKRGTFNPATGKVEYK